MSSTAHDRPSRPRGFRAVALVALLSLSCTTVRVPASGIPASVQIRGETAEPQVELWVESGNDVSPAEAAKAAADARAALEQALAGRRLGDGGQLLVVRAQGVSRTVSRRTDQTAAAAGLVVAAVVIVAVAVVALAAAGKSGKAPSAHPAPAPGARPAPVPGAVATHPAPAPAPAAFPRPALPTPTPPAPVAVRAPPRPSGGPGHGEIGFAFGANIQVEAPPAPDGPPAAVWSESIVTGPPPPTPPPPPPEPGPDEIVLPPPPPLDVERRGFFAGDSTRLELTLVDRATMRPLWVKAVESKDDPRDTAAVRALLDRALADPRWWYPAQPVPLAEAPGA